MFLYFAFFFCRIVERREVDVRCPPRKNRQGHLTGSARAQLADDANGGKPVPEESSRRCQLSE